MFGMGGRKGAADKPRAAAPRPAKKQALVSVQVKLEPRHREKLALLGGDAWIREQIEQAKLASPFSE